MTRQSACIIALLLAASCKRSPMGRVEAMRDELTRTSDAPHWDDALPACTDRATCTAMVATAIGAPYDDKKPDQISAATVAVIVARDHHGSDVGAPEVWLTAVRIAKGAGADALRLAIALEMSRASPKHAKPLDGDADARAFLADVASAIPGACKTYESLGGGADPDAMPAPDSPDHSACVQRDLSRTTGPGGTYGYGLFRGAAGALALWKAMLSALHDGAGQMDVKHKEALDRRLAVIDAATPKIAPKIVAAPPGNTWTQMEGEHNAPLSADAGPAKK